MKTIIDMHISLNGMITDANGGEDWLPHEGWDEFKLQAAKYGNVIMGRNTYETVSSEYEENFDVLDAELKIIVTSQLDYAAPDGYTVAHSPEEAIKVVEEASMEVAYVIGGGRLNGAFMKRGLVDGLHITINPYVLGSGKNIFEKADFSYQLKLLATKEISLGRVVNDYEVVK
jgi:dihydrofolate reductase